jgi:hypothetical protein
MGSAIANSRSRFHSLNFGLDPINYFKPEHPKPQQVGGQFPRVPGELLIRDTTPGQFQVLLE